MYYTNCAGDCPASRSSINRGSLFAAAIFRSTAAIRRECTSSGMVQLSMPL